MEYEPKGKFIDNLDLDSRRQGKAVEPIEPRAPPYWYVLFLILLILVVI